MAKIDKRNRMIAIADYLFGNPNKDRADILATFGKKWQMPNRTIDRVIKEAKEYNSKRISEQEKIRNEELSVSAKESIKKDILSQDEALEILTKIARGVNRIVGEATLAPSDSERTKAIVTLSDIKGWKAPLKTAQTDSQGNDIILTEKEKQKLIDKL